MAASNYMVELDTESIWGTGDFDTTRFGKMGVRIAEIFNAVINLDATVQVTSTAVTPLLEMLSEEAFIRLVAAAKISAVTDPWEFIAANTVSVTSKVLRDNKDILNTIMVILGKTHPVEFSSLSGLGSSGDI